MNEALGVPAPGLDLVQIKVPCKSHRTLQLPRSCYLDGADVLSFFALTSFADLEFNGLTLFEILESVAFDV